MASAGQQTGGRPAYEDLPSKIEGYLQRARDNVELPINVRAIADDLGISPQTIYNRDKVLPEAERFAARIRNARRRRDALEKRVKRRRSSAADAKRIDDLEDQLEKANQKYNNVLSRLIMVENAFRGTEINLDEIYRTGMLPPDRSHSKAGMRSRDIRIPQ